MRERSRMARVSVEEYLELDRQSFERLEFLDGRVAAMTGATDSHNIICVNLSSFMHTRLRSSGCRVYQSDMKVRVRSANCIFYPDIFVTCEKVASQAIYKESPVIIFEVTSKSTKHYDGTEKLNAYKTIPSLREYVIVSQDRRHISVHRNVDGNWITDYFSSSFELELQSFPGGTLKISSDGIYLDTDLPN
ncbi:Uma2 family endonuclease [Candidatus Obscuribacterales bacterium]|nr:Uma2 family endonuclease [Candidatus Obscuribacterales bacterium]